MVFVNGKFLKDLDHSHKRELTALRQRETELLDRLMHITGKTWVLPPKEKLSEGETLIDEDTKLLMEGWREA